MYKQKYQDIPIDFNERLNWMCDKYKLSQSKMNEILNKRDTMIDNLFYYDYDIIQLLEEPEGSKRPRFRLINRKNYNIEAISSGNFVHVYTIGARDDYLCMRRIVDEGELISLSGLVMTPVIMDYTAYFPTPNSYSDTDKNAG